MAGIQIRALYQFESGGDEELNLNAGEVLTVIRQDVGDGWWECRNSQGKVGLVPEAYVEIQSMPEPSLPPPPLPPIFNHTNNVEPPSQRQTWQAPAEVHEPPAQRQTWNNPPPPSQPPQRQPTAPPAAELPTPGDKTDNYDDWDDDWDDDDSSTTTEAPELGSVSGRDRKDSSNRKDGKDDKGKFGTVRSKPLSRFSNFTKMGGEDYLFRSSMLSINEAEKKAFIVESPNGPVWQGVDSPYQCIIKSPKKESKFKGMKTFIVYQITPTYSNIQVSRRYKHFDWLHDRLLEKYSVCAVPPLPDKQVTGRFEEEFIQERMRQLQLWIDRLCRHPILAFSDVFNHFQSCTDDKNWKNGKRKAEKDGYQGIKFFHTVQIPPKKLDPIDVEIQIDNHWKFVKSMDDSVKHLMAVGDHNIKKSQTSVKKEFCKLGGSFVALARAFDHDKSTDSSMLTQAIENTGRTYEDIGKLHEEQPKHDMAHLMEGLQEYKGILSTFPDVLSVYKAASSKIQENVGRLPDDEITQVQDRANIIAYATLAEMNHFNQYRTGDFKHYIQQYLQGQIQFYKNITERLEKALSEYDKV